MKELKRAFLVTVIFICCHVSFAQSNLKLWYNVPAVSFEEALPLGNGKTGATVFGGVSNEKIYLNDITLWSGGPVDLSHDPGVVDLIPKVREALANEDYRTAEQINKQIEGKFSESYSPLGTLFLEFGHAETSSNYYRELDISNATVRVSYEQNGVTFKREYMVSNPDKVLVIRLTASEPGELNFRIKFQSLLNYTTVSADEMLLGYGYAPYFAWPSYMGRSLPDPIRFDESKGTRFETAVKVKNQGGSVAYSDSAIDVTSATSAVVYLSTATSFNGFDKDPVNDGADYKQIAESTVKAAFEKSFDDLKERHVKDYQTFFNRVKLDLNGSSAPDLPTDQRLKNYTEGAIDYELESLYFQYGRYLLISCSRTEGVPANLQGIWNPYIRPPWSCNYTMNINAEENYWLAESANLSEMHQPFLTFVERLAITGRHTAKAFYGIDKGWAAGHNSDIWATSNPVGEEKISPRSASWNMGGTWAVTHLWEHYLFTGDKAFLEQKAYPLMKGAADFCLAWIVKDKEGHWITSPSTSPEAHYVTPDGFAGATLYGATSDLAMIRECFEQTIKASKILNKDESFRKKLEETLSQFHPYRVGQKGNLQEWYHDWEDEEPQHRHQSHLYGLYPGHHISINKTPELAKAAMKSLDIRGDKATGWSTGWRINLWARLRDGNRSYRIVRALLTYVEPAGEGRVIYSGNGGTYPNLFDAHPPFQIDGNFGGAAGILEMLLQSTDEEIDVLPALPDVWKSGTVSGVCARGGFELSIKWNNGKLERVEILSRAGNPCRLKYGNRSISFRTQKGGSYKFDGQLKRAR